MKVSKAIHSYQEYHRLNSKKNTLKNYDFLFTRFTDEFGERAGLLFIRRRGETKRDEMHQGGLL